MGNSTRNRLEYQNRVNRVIDYIQSHRADDLSLEALAAVAAFSPFHFHRVFKAVVGENLKEFVQRVRLEWAGSALMARPLADVLEIALDSGFQSASAFARAFKEHFGMSATEWRAGGAQTWSKNRIALRKPGQPERKHGKESAGQDTHPSCCGENESPSETEDLMNVTVKTLPGYRLAYMRNVGPYGANSAIPQLWQRLQRWAAPRDLWTSERLCLGIAYDHPQITEPDKCRYDAGIVIPADFKADTQVNVIDFVGGKFAMTPFAGTALDIAASWDRFYGGWLPQSGYQPDDRPCLEIYGSDAFDEQTGVVKCQLCMPVKPL